jgi:hypothetical protein
MYQKAKKVFIFLGLLGILLAACASWRSITGGLLQASVKRPTRCSLPCRKPTRISL